MHNCNTWDTEARTWCGSNYDRVGNARITSSLKPYDNFDRLKDGEFDEGLAWGYTSYDNIFRAFTATFQAVSQEGWTGIMYQTIDAWSTVPSVIIFVLLILIGGNIVLNLVLAVITSSLDEEDEEDEEEGEGEEKEDKNGDNAEKDTEVKVYTGLEGVVRAKWFGNLIMVFIFINTVVLAMDHNDMDKGLEETLEVINMILTFVFLFEMILTIPGIGPHAYFTDPVCVFDAIIVVTSIVELVLSMSAEEGEGGGGGLSAFRTFRLFRVFKMAKEWKSLQILLKTMLKTILEIGNFAVLLLLFMFIYALIGMQFFSNRMRFYDSGEAIPITEREDWADAWEGSPRNNFDDFLWSMTTIFQVLTGEDWNACMYDAWRGTGWGAVVYFISLVIFGAFIVMNLFLAILLGNFEGNEELMGAGGEEADGLGGTKYSSLSPDTKVESLAAASAMGDKWRKKATKRESEEKEGEAIKEEIQGDDEPAIPDNKALWIFDNKSALRIKCHELMLHPNFDKFIIGCIVFSSICLALDNPLNDPDSGFTAVLELLDQILTFVFIIEMLIKMVALGFMLHHGSYIRNAWNKLDFFIVIISVMGLAKIGPSSALKPMRTIRILRPLRMISRYPELKLVVDALMTSVPETLNVLVISCLFLLIFAIFGVNYLKGTFNSCNTDDCPLISEDPVMGEFLHQWQEGEGHSPVTYDMLDSNQKADFGECPGLNGTAAAFVDDGRTAVDSKILSREVCECLCGEDAWEAMAAQNFDNVFQAFALLWEITSTEGWTSVMYAAVDQRGPGMQHVRDNNTWWVAFFWAFMLVGAFFVMELFVGVIIDNFNRIRETKGRVFMTESQEEWATTKAFIMKIKPERKIPRPKGSVGGKCYDFVMPNLNPKFDQFIMTCIILNSSIMAVQHFTQTDGVTAFIDIANYLFALIFTIEAVLKLTALGRKYFNDSWNKFDFIIVIGTNTGILVRWITGVNVGSVASIVRMFRIGRLFRLINSAKSLRILFNTLLSSIPSLVNIGGLLFLLFFIYAIMGVQLFAHIQMDGDDMTVHANFHGFWEAMINLFRFSTGENWNGYMHTIMSDADGCVKADDFKYDPSSPWCFDDDSNMPNCTPINGCGGAAISGLEKPFTVFYFYSFTLMVTFIMMNLFVGVVMDAFDANEEGDILGPEDLDTFTAVWAEFDPDATYHITVDDLKQFIDDLPPPMGFGKDYHASDDELNKTMRETGLWDIPVDKDNRVQIVQVATSLAKRIVRLKQGESFADLNSDHPIEKKLKSSMRTLDRCVGDVLVGKAKVDGKKKSFLNMLAPKKNSQGENKPIPEVEPEEEKKGDAAGAGTELPPVNKPAEEEAADAPAEGEAADAPAEGGAAEAK